MPVEFFVDSAIYYNSSHWDFKCIDCHSDEYEIFPHIGELRMEDKYTCLDCHEDDKDFPEYNFEEVSENYELSVHSKKHYENFSCWSCHDAHGYKVNFRKTTKLLDVIKYDNAICLDCHSNKDNYQLLKDTVMPDISASHDWLTNRELHFKKVRCIECHVEKHDSILVSHNILPANKSVKTCVDCHSENSLLLSTLYKFPAFEKRSKKGFINNEILNESYVIGATRSFVLNVVSFVFILITFLGIIIHIFFRLKIKKPNKALQADKIYLYPFWVRVWHIINALLFLVLIITGISMQYSNPDYPGIRFDLAVTWHNVAGVLLAISYVFFVVGNIISGNSKYYWFTLRGYSKHVAVQFKYYLFGMFKGDDCPYPLDKDNKFNPLQKISYVIIAYFVLFLSVISGLALLFPEFIIKNVFGLNGTFLTALVHLIMSFVLTIFLVIHIYFSTLGKTPTSNFKSIIAGWH